MGLARVVLDREEQFRHRLIEVPPEEVRQSDSIVSRPNSGTRTKTQRRLDALDRCVRLAGKIAEGTTDVPTARTARVQRQCAIDQCDPDADVFAEIGQCESGIGQDARVIQRGGGLRSFLGKTGTAQSHIQCFLAERPVFRVGIPWGMGTPLCQ